MRAAAAVALSMLVLLAGGAARASAATHTVTYDHYSLSIDGQRTYVWGAEFHYWRLPSPDLWRDVLQKLKAGGFNTVSLYFDWAYHSPKPGVYDFSGGTRDIDRLLRMTEQEGLYVIARPGPYINAETDSGGFPGWVDTLAGRSRSNDPDFVAASDEWLHQVDAIIARHQLTDGGGNVILYQVENEYGSNTSAAYMQHTEQTVRGDGITVPLTHNYCCGSANWATGPGAVDIPGQDSYPQGFNCSNPTQWSAPGTLPRFRDDAPIFSPEFQGGAFDPWGGPGYENCRRLTGPDFEKVFYKTNVGAGATLQSFYMTFGGTSWGWLPDPSQVYTSYDYGAAITEPRQLTSKYDELKRQGYFLTSTPSLLKTDAFAPDPPTSAAIAESGRVNPDDHAQFLLLRHADGRATSDDSTHVAIDLGAHAGYTYDDRDAVLQYAGAWSHVGPEQSYTGGDYMRTESFSNVAGDSMTYAFTGTGVRWISGGDTNHGIADVYLDDVKVATVDGYSASKSTQRVFYSASGLADGPHTLRIVVTGTRRPAATGAFVIVDAIDVPTPGSVVYPSVPQEPGTAIRLNGRDAKLLPVNLLLAGQRLVYSTSELMTSVRDIALLYGRSGEAGETVLRFATQPPVTTLAGTPPQVTWDAVRGDLRLNYVHDGLTELQVGSLRLLIADDATAATFWRFGDVLVRGPSLVRTATVSGDTLAVTGDAAAAAPLQVWAPPGVARVTWNGAPATGSVAGPPVISLPALTGWRFHAESPETRPDFDDSGWARADHATTTNPTKPAAGQPVLYADDYGFHHGDIWYRGHFTGTPASAVLNAITGRAGIYQVWLNGQYLGDHGTGTGTFPLTGLRDGDNVLAVLVRNMGHNEDFNANETNKEPRGLVSAVLAGTTVDWRIQGNQGGEDITDTVRGPINNGGLYGERAGWYLEGYPDSGWAPVSLPDAAGSRGVGWYRTTFALDEPAGVDASVGLTIADPPSKVYRAQIFLNGWNLGQYVNNVGPQHTFVLPNGLLRTHGRNTLAIAVISSSGGLGSVSLTDLGTVASPLAVADEPSPAYAPPVVHPLVLDGTTVNGPVATLDVPPDAQGTAFAATIDWGDGTRSDGVVSGSVVSGTHTYSSGGRHRVAVFVSDRYGDAPLAGATADTGDVGGTVPATLSLTLGPPASFGAFTPGVDHEYTASTTANVISTAGDATLSVSDPGHLANGSFTLPEPLRVELAPTSWTGPVSNASVAITFRQHIGANDALRTGTYSRTLTFTLSTTTP